MKIISVILARGGSKGIPKKNLINIKEKSLISYTINASLNSKVSETWVSTEDKFIKQEAISHGAQVLDRPAKYSTDICQSEDALIHFAQNIESDIIVFIQPTSPLLSSKYIDNLDGQIVINLINGILRIDHVDKMLKVLMLKMELFILILEILY